MWGNLGWETGCLAARRGGNFVSDAHRHYQSHIQGQPLACSLPALLHGLLGPTLSTQPHIPQIRLLLRVQPVQLCWAQISTHQQGLYPPSRRTLTQASPPSRFSMSLKSAPKPNQANLLSNNEEHVLCLPLIPRTSASLSTPSPACQAQPCPHPCQFSKTFALSLSGLPGQFILFPRKLPRDILALPKQQPLSELLPTANPTEADCILAWSCFSL